MGLVLTILLAAAASAALLLLAVRALLRRKYDIRSPSGIQTAGYVSINGAEQYVCIRGQDRSNPVLLVLHGGPGRNMAYYSYGWQGALEREYTVVHWDQRGCGNTYYRNPGAEPPALELLLSDLDALIDCLRRAFGAKKLLLLGHSWGTFLGARYAARHPEKVSALISVSQMVDFKGSEKISSREAARRARAAGHERDAECIEARLAKVQGLRTFGSEEARALLALRRSTERYLPGQGGGRLLPFTIFSPYMTWADLRWLLEFQTSVRVNRPLFEALLEEDASLSRCCLRFEVPVILVSGAEDWTTPRVLARQYFEAIAAPRKQFLTVEHAGHLPFLDRPEAFSAALLDALRRLPPD